ncbi:hypothetical protein [Streptomyces sp. NRRL F-5630]
MDRIGITAFNRVWTTPELFPLKSEAAEPDLWVKRVETSMRAEA